MDDWLRKFVRESNRIEGIGRTTRREYAATAAFLDLAAIQLGDLQSLNAVLSGAPLRRRVGMDVRVGDHLPPPGGPHIIEQLESLLRAVNASAISPFVGHCIYESLHPFMDGNGRTGRALWLWQEKQRGGWDWKRAQKLGFLHCFYYQTLGQHEHYGRDVSQPRSEAG